jgi:two-component system, cell cycle sensor histidine kinase and response regulator CckA
VQRAGERAASLVRQLLAFSRRQVMRTAPVDLSAVVGNLDGMLRRLLGDGIELAAEVEPELGYILADRAHIEQVIVALVANARDAMPSGGRATITTAAVGAAEAAAASLAPGSWLRLSVEDTGVGIDGEAQHHLFEPFFTTKAVGRGTGLGLSAIYGIVTQSGGQIRVASEVGRGSRFDLYFPHHGAAAQS